MAGQLTIDTLKASSGVLATQNGMTGIAKAWVNFAGASGSVTNSYNVSSVTRNGTGNYNINFTTTMPNANYVVTGVACLDGTIGVNGTPCFIITGTAATSTTTTCQIACVQYNTTAADRTVIQVCFSGN